MRMAAQGRDIGERSQQEADRCDRPHRNRQSPGGEQSVSIDGGGEDQLKIRASEQRPGEVRDRLADDPGKNQRGSRGDNRHDSRGAVRSVFNAEEPARDRIGCGVQRHEHKDDENREAPQRQCAEHRREGPRAQAQIVQDETGKGGQGPNQPSNQAARPA